MKKLMITLSAAVLAFGVFADGAFIAGDNFNGKALTDLTAWSGLTDDTAAISATPYSFSQEGTVGAPNEYREVAASDNLTLKTPFNSPASYTLSASGYSIPGQLYFDSLVKFTACDEAPGDYDGAKLIVWIKEEDDASQKLMITAGKITSDGPVRQDYECGAPSDYDIGADGDWCRLTIKAVADITDGDIVPGFVVFVNGKAVTITTPKDIGIDGTALTKVMALWKKSNQLFPSLVAQDATVKAVCFAGQGAVDDVCFTTVEPNNNITDPATEELTEFAKDPVPDVAEVTINGAAVPVADAAAINTALAGLGEGDVATIKLTEGDLKLADDMDDGLEIPNVAATVTIDLNGQTLSAGDDCTTAITAGEAVTLIITDSSVEQTGVVDGDVYATATSIEAGTFEGYVSIGDGSEITGGKFSTEAGNDPETLNQYVDTDTLKKELKDNGEGYLVLTKIVVKHSVIFIVDGSETGRIQYEEGAEIPAPTGPDPTSANAWESFAGWSDGSSIVTFPLTMGEADITLTATFKFLNGEGTAAAPWQIGTAADLDKFAKYAAANDTAGKYFVQTADINLGGITFGVTTFKGTYDGDNKALSGFKFPRTGTYGGFFGTLDGGTVENLKVTYDGFATDDTPAAEYGASFVGNVKNGGVIRNITTDGELEARHNVAGIVVRMYGPSSVIACTNKATLITNGSKNGGIVNLTKAGSGTCLIENCSNEGTVKTIKGGAEGNKTGLAGIIAYTEDGDKKGLITKIVNCSNSGSLIAETNANLVAAFMCAGGSSKVVFEGVNKAAVGLKPYNSGTIEGCGAAVNEDGVASWYANFATALAAYDNNDGLYVKAIDATFTEIANVADSKVGIGTKVNKDITDSLSTYAVAGTKLEAGEGFWTIVAAAAPEDWDNPKTPIVPGETKAADAWPSLAETPLANADAAKLAAWAKDTTKGNITFDKADEILVDAFLLDCANTAGAVATAKAAFKVTSITQDAEGNWVAKVGEAGEGDGYKNGYITIVPYDLEGAGDDAEFFQAKLLLQPVTKE